MRDTNVLPKISAIFKWDLKTQWEPGHQVLLIMIMILIIFLMILLMILFVRFHLKYVVRKTN